MKKFTIRIIVTQAMVAAIYAALTLCLAPISFGVVQFRVSEALTLLPFISPICTVGLTIGCLVSNIIGGYGMLDIVFGSLATLLAGLWTSRLKKTWLAPLPPVICNTIIVGAVITWSTTAPSTFWTVLPPICLQFMVEETAVCFILGIPLLALLKKSKLDRQLSR